MSSVQPDTKQFKGLLKMPKDQPVFMVNLLKFNEKTADGESGAEVYARYSKNMQPLLEKHGAEVVFAGSCEHLLIGIEADHWHSVVVVKYPSPRHFIKMSSSEEYAAVQHDREAALEKTTLLVNHQLSV